MDYTAENNRKLKIALVYASDFYLYRFRQGLIKKLIENGHEVYAITPSGEYVEKIKKLGAKHIEVKMNRFTNTWQDWKMYWQLRKICRERKFDLVHNFTIKPNVFSTWAAAKEKIPKIIMSVTGFGIFNPEAAKQNLKSKVLLVAAKFLYKKSCVKASKVWFQNQEDLDYFVQHNLCLPAKAVLIKSSGINLDEFNLQNIDQSKLIELKQELGIKENDLVFIMVSRIHEQKGIKEYLKAAKQISQKFAQAKFILSGGEADKRLLGLIKEQNSENFKFLGFRKDIKELLAISNVVVLPSYYGEGVPRTLLEAMAMSKPIITTDHTGCRETVENNYNGFLVPVRSSEGLANAIQQMINNPQNMASMGPNSRQKAQKEFDEQIVISRIIRELYNI